MKGESAFHRRKRSYALDGWRVVAKRLSSNNAWHEMQHAEP
jgi:hypothetical protein